MAADLEVQVRAGGAARSSDARHGLTLAHEISLGYFVSCVVCVDARESAIVLDDHDVAVAGDLIAVDDAAIARGIDGGALRGGDVDAVVEAVAARTDRRGSGAPLLATGEPV